MSADETPPIRIAIIPVTPLQQNCTMIWRTSDKLGAIIDPGGDVDHIMKIIADNEVTIEKIVLTHGHIDHAAGADELRERLDVQIEGPHRDDRFLLDTLTDDADKYGIEDVRNVAPDLWFDDGQTCTMAGYNFDVFHCPGHSPGSLVYVNRALSIALVGDVIFRGSIGRTDFPYGDHDALINAIKTKLLPLGDDIAFICGHGPTSTFGHERQTNPFLA